MDDDSASTGDLFLMSPPGPQWALRGRANFRSRAAPVVNPERAFAEWLALARAIEAAGGRVAVLPHDEELTGLPYCAEAGHPLPAIGDGPPRFVLPRMWAPHRKRERERWASFATALGFSVVSTERGYWEGQGDVSTFRGTTLLFYGGRTDREGLDAVRPLFADDAVVIEVIEPAFHGNVAALGFDAIDRLIVCPELIAGSGMESLVERFGDERILRITIDEATCYATNALPIGATLIAPTLAPERVLDAATALGARVVRLDMRELCEKAGGASRCLVCRVPAAIGRQLAIPESATVAAVAAARGQRP